MKDTWLLYDYLRGWWRLLLMGFVLGATLGLGYYSTQDHPMRYTVTANLLLEEPEYTGEGSPSTVSFAIDPIRRSTGESAIEDFRLTVAKLGQTTGSTVLTQDFSIDMERTDELWWKAMVFGSAVGTLLVVVGVYVWEDARGHRNRRQTGGEDA
jgi:hypothetical protein